MSFLPVFLLSLLVTEYIVANCCLQVERDALIEFKTGMMDPGNRLASWKGLNCCRWVGIECSNHTGHVIKLNLTNLGSESSSLSGEISPSLLVLIKLKYLDLSNNDLSGKTFPKFICSFRNLEYLDLSSTNLSGLIPPQISNMSKLQTLFLGSDESADLSINNMGSLSHLTSLKYLSLYGVNLEDSSEWVQALNMLPSLELLYLYRNNLTSIPSSLPNANFSSLTEFYLISNNFNSPIPSWIGKITGLTSLFLESCGFFDQIPNTLSNLKSLNELMLADYLEGPFPLLHNLHNLTYLELNNIYINEDITDLVSKLSSDTLTKLESLALINTSLTGNLSGWIYKMTNLSYFILDQNNLIGRIPVEIGYFANLLEFSLSENSFVGEIYEVHLTNLSRLKYLDLSYNSITINIRTDNWIPSFQLSELYLTDCKLGPKFPSWLRNQTQLDGIHLSNTSIVDNLPDWFRNLTSLRNIDLSNNQIFGNLSSLENFSQLQMITLRDNQFHGEIPSFSHSLITLDLSYNSISGPLPSKFNAPLLYILVLSNNLIDDIMDQYICGLLSLEILDLSNNNIYGDLPDCWPNTLKIVNLANNNIGGIIPSSMSNLSMLISLQLNNNNLIGEFPSSLRLCKNLSIIDLGENRFYGRIPKWLGEITNLNVLRLRSNLFFGDIPTQLVHLPNIQVLDLGDNNISGLIPLHMDKMLAMTSPNKNLETNSTYANFERPNNHYYNISMSISMKGSELVYSTSLILLKSIDLSGNNLTGVIPRSIFALVGLINLNLSNNNLNGTIPMEIGNMRLLESLDLKMNELSGIIPRSLSNLNFLAKLNLSYNNLSGEIPIGNQLQTLLDPYIYIGNAYLCGSPLNKSCNAEQTLPNDIMQNDNNHLDEILLYLFTVMGLGFGFWLFVGVLMFKQNWRYRFFQKVDNIFDTIYVFVMIYLAKLMKYLIK